MNFGSGREFRGAGRSCGECCEIGAAREEHSEQELIGLTNQMAVRGGIYKGLECGSDECRGRVFEHGHEVDLLEQLGAASLFVDAYHTAAIDRHQVLVHAVIVLVVAHLCLHVSNMCPLVTEGGVGTRGPVEAPNTVP
jgi:hypothetical protein